MRKHIEERGFDDLFSEYWKNTRTEFFKCEVQQAYDEEGEEEFISLFKEGKIDELHQMLREDVQDSNSIWQDAIKRGIDFFRIHVYTSPISDYLRFELEAYRIQSKVGNERIWMVSHDLMKSKYHGELKDFMVFDNKVAMIVEYDSDHKIKDVLLTDENDDMDRLRKLRQIMIESGEPIDDFLIRYDNSKRQDQ